VAPRRRAQGRPASRIHWDKLGRVVLVLVLFVILFSYINPVVNFVDAWRDSHAQRNQLEQLQHQHSRLAAKAAALDDPGAAARRRGSWAWSPRTSTFVMRGLHSEPPGGAPPLPDGGALGERGLRHGAGRRAHAHDRGVPGGALELTLVLRRWPSAPTGARPAVAGLVRAPARLAEAVLAVAGLIWISEALGTFGGSRRAPCSVP
jgi:hypothetical protein